MNAPPDKIAGMRVVTWTPLDARHRPTGKTRHQVAGGQPPKPAGLAICSDGQGAFYLFACDAAWRTITDTWHQDLEAARAQAEFEYAGVSATWAG